MEGFPSQSGWENSNAKGHTTKPSGVCPQLVQDSIKVCGGYIKNSREISLVGGGGKEKNPFGGMKECL